MNVVRRFQEKTIIVRLSRVARWFIFRPKIPILKDLGMENVEIYSGHFEYFTAIGYVHFMGILEFLLSFDRFRPLWYIVPRKIWQPCANLTTST
jgi:hypothetical protein